MEKVYENAVSPVVGVMLMLVVVIIIAALVSAFSGNLVGSDSKPPQATIQGRFSASAGILQMFHAGGDTLPTEGLFMQITTNDEDFTGYRGTIQPIMINRSMVYTVSGKQWLNPSNGIVNVPSWRPGETMWTNITSVENSFWGIYAKPEDIGKSLILEISNKNGKLISKSKVLIEP